ncbi:MAG: hypothetical protein KAI72_06935, partial [Candidatus Pacebacteria bacterium]|nr:hypothetical protein [Candidatus Paceibacterota bacterium]
MDQNIKNTKPQRSRKKLFLKVSIISVGIFVVPIFFNNSVAQSVDGSTIIETVEIVEPTVGVVEPNSEEDASLLSEFRETTVIESGDFSSSLQDILDVSADNSVEFTLTPEENGDNTTTIESGDFAS